MFHLRPRSGLAGLFAFLLSQQAASAAKVEGNCLAGIPWFNVSSYLSADAIISCRGQPSQLFNAGRYWGKNDAKNASIVALPATAKDVSLLTKVVATLAPDTFDWTFVGGAHSQVNASSASDFIIDLKNMDAVEFLPSYTLPDGSRKDVVSFEGGATTGHVLDALNGTGKSIITARVRSVGLGGFSTGGGIGFLSGKYGFATDRIVKMEVVLPSGDQVVATKTNSYSDLFFALQGGNGQFGIVTKFYALTLPTPTSVTLGATFLAPEDYEAGIANLANWYNNNKDPFAVAYFFATFGPGPGQDATNPANFAVRPVYLLVKFDGSPDDTIKQDFKSAFNTLLSGLGPNSFTTNQQTDYAHATAIMDNSFVYGFRRAFYGPQVPSITSEYVKKGVNTLQQYVQEAIARGEFPAGSIWGLQYMFPNLSGNLPKSASDTAWPHNTVGHQTLFSPAQTKAQNDDLFVKYTGLLNKLTYDRQTALKKVIPDYPNYISLRTVAGISKSKPGPAGPVGSAQVGWDGSRVWGPNVARLQTIKEKYDPKCSLKQGPVFSSKTCTKKGLATIF